MWNGFDTGATLAQWASHVSTGFTSSLLPVSMRIATQTVGLDLVSVVPMGYDDPQKALVRERMEKLKSMGVFWGEMLQRVDAIIKENQPSGPNIDLLYLDFKYTGSTASSHSTPSATKSKRGRRRGNI